jgi:hypothetical protein
MKNRKKGSFFSKIKDTVIFIFMIPFILIIMAVLGFVDSIYKIFSGKSFLATGKPGDYKRLVYWIEDRIGSYKGKDNNTIKKRLNDLYKSECSRLKNKKRVEGLKAYIENDLYKELIK